MSKKIAVCFLAAFALVCIQPAQAQPAKVYRVGVVFEGGPFYAALDGRNA